MGTPAKLQRGSTLVVSMIILVVLMLLGVTATVISDTQYRLAGNLQFQDAAFNDAETNLAQAEAELIPLGGPQANSLAANTQITGVTRGTAVLLSTGNRLAESSQIVGSRASTGCNVVNIFRVTANGSSRRGAVRRVQSIYSVLACE